MTISAWLHDATTRLDAAGIPSARLDAELIVAHALGTTRVWLIAHAQDDVPTTHAETLIEQRIQRVPLAYLIGHKEFYGRDFIVTPAVLTPRPESEAIIDLAKEYFSDADREPINVIDLGTGSGCLGITVSLEIPHTAVTITDVSAEALMVASQNAHALGAYVSCFVSDLFEAFSLPSDSHLSSARFQLIIANLPYVNPSWQRSPETDHEPSLALFADDNGRALIKKCIQQSQRWIAKNGIMLIEADPCQHESIIEYARGYGYRHDTTRDYIVALRAD